VKSRGLRGSRCLKDLKEGWGAKGKLKEKKR
jgi:hypothetical protein